jgi:hypothetical protein
VPPDLPVTTGPAAASAHDRAVALLVKGDVRAAVTAFRGAITEDPCFALGYAGLAVALSALAEEDEREDAVESLTQARRCSRRLSRRERHHVEVVVLALRGRTSRASALGREHLDEFPADTVVHFVLEQWCGDQVAGEAPSASSSSTDAEAPRS